jgi:hypothetical protein
MPSSDLTLSAFLQLARISNERGQMMPRNKFLILSAAAACDSGCLLIAERCRDVVLDNNPAHMLNRFETIPDALRSTEFQVYLKQLRKFCSVERAEQLLAIQDIELTPLAEQDAIQLLDALRAVE